MIRICAFGAALALLALAGCGADGPPQRPGQAEPAAVAISGEAQMGVAYHS